MAIKNVKNTDLNRNRCWWYISPEELGLKDNEGRYPTKAMHINDTAAHTVYYYDVAPLLSNSIKPYSFEKNNNYECTICDMKASKGTYRMFKLLATW